MRWCAVHDSDLPAFQRVVTQLAAAVNKKLDDTVIPTYFRLLQGQDLREVARAADAWAQRSKFFPMAAEWLETVRSLPKGEPLLELPRDEMAEWLDAERRGFEADVCSCQECAAAGATALLLRFVPTEDRFGEHEKRLLGHREVLRGHWAHGYELVRWHVAREACMVKWRGLKLGSEFLPVREALPQ